MTTAEVNLALALITWALATLIAGSHIRQLVRQHMGALLGVFVWVAATLLVLTAAGSFLGADLIDAVRFLAAFLRGILLVLVAAYSWDRWVRRAYG